MECGTQPIMEQMHFIIYDSTLAVGLVDIYEDSCAELDSNVNMPIAGNHAYVLDDTGRMADVNAFTPHHRTLVIPVTDEAIRYKCPYEVTDAY